MQEGPASHQTIASQAHHLLDPQEPMALSWETIPQNPGRVYSSRERQVPALLALLGCWGRYFHMRLPSKNLAAIASFYLW